MTNLSHELRNIAAGDPTAESATDLRYLLNRAADELDRLTELAGAVTAGKTFRQIRDEVAAGHD